MPSTNTARLDCKFGHSAMALYLIVALSASLLLPAGGGLTRRDALAVIAATPALLARPAAAPAARSAVPTKDIESIKVLTYYLLCLYYP
eukprot:scaffold12381_cov63-Phaeocystis_antarctica.AAC.9